MLLCSGGDIAMPQQGVGVGWRVGLLDWHMLTGGGWRAVGRVCWREGKGDAVHALPGVLQLPLTGQ